MGNLVEISIQDLNDGTISTIQDLIQTKKF